MLWFYFTLLSAVLYALSNILDKHVITDYFKRPLVSVGIASVVSFIVAVIIALPQTVVPQLNILALVLFTGLLLFLANYLYFKAVFGEEISRVIPVYSVEPIFILVMAALFLGEILLPIQYVGIFLIIGGSILISLRKKEKFELSQSFFLVILSTFLYASSNVILKYCLNYINFWSTFFWQMTGLLIVTIIAVSFSFNTVKQTIKQFPRAGGYAVFSELLSSAAHLIYILALSLGLVTLVSGVMASLPAVTMVFAAITSLILPKVIKEDLSKTTLLQKAIAIALVIIGTFLLL